MDLFLVELTVADWRASLAWYRDRLGLTVVLADEPNRYALLAAGRGHVALKAGAPVPGTTKVVFRVESLESELARLAARGIRPAGPVKASAEGYRSAQLADPDGHWIEIFEWIGANPLASPNV